MLLKNFLVNTDLGAIKTLVAHCDECGKKHFISSDTVGGAMAWLELRRFDREVPPIHFCSLECLLNGIKGLADLGVSELNTENWPRILERCTKAGEREENIANRFQLKGI
jgi:hypothetical protein